MDITRVKSICFNRDSAS